MDLKQKILIKLTYFFSGKSESAIKNRGSHLKYFLLAMRISSVISIFQKIKNSPGIMNARKVLRKFFNYFFVT